MSAGGVRYGICRSCGDAVPVRGKPPHTIHHNDRKLGRRCDGVGLRVHPATVTRGFPR